MTKLTNCASISDFVARAEARLPGFAWRYLSGDAGDNLGTVRNLAAFQEILFRPKRLVPPNVSTTTSLFGVGYDQPFGIAPMALCNMAWPGTDRAMARVARAKNIPHVISTASSTSLEDLAEIAPDNLWFQLYVSKEPAVTTDLMARAWAAGLRTLVLTVDSPGAARRHLSLRAHDPSQLARRMKTTIELMLRPTWSLQMLKHGRARLGNFRPYGTLGCQSLAQVCHDGRVSWEHLQRVRDSWPGNLVIKGVMDGDDAGRMMREGADGIWVSNHGGRQLESFPSSIAVLPGIRAAVGPGTPIMLDSGIRSGEDILKAIALGADFVFAGRCFLYGAAAYGADGVEQAYSILAAEISTALTQIGAPSPKALDQAFIYNPPIILNKMFAKT